MRIGRREANKKKKKRTQIPANETKTQSTDRIGRRDFFKSWERDFRSSNLGQVFIPNLAR